MEYIKIGKGYIIVGFDERWLNISIDFKLPYPASPKTILDNILACNLYEKYNIGDKLWERHARRKRYIKKSSGFSILCTTQIYLIQIQSVQYTINMEVKY